MSSVVSCPDRDTLHRLLLGKLPGPSGEALAHHLEQCSACTSAAKSVTAKKA